MRGKEFIFMLLPCGLLAGAGFFFARREAAQEAAMRRSRGITLAGRSAGKTKGQLKPTSKPVFYKIGKFTVRDMIVGTGAKASNGRTLTVHYSGILPNGTKFDSSWQRSQPFSFSLGSGQVIPGWEKGFVGMRIGGKRRLIIPPAMAYGTAGSPPIVPPNATLIFDVQLLDVQ